MGRARAGTQRRQGSSCKLIFYRTPRKIREANYSDNHRGPEAFPWKSGITQDYLSPRSSPSACGSGTAPATPSWATWGSTAPNKELWQPPGIPLLWLTELVGMGGGVWGWVLTWAPLCLFVCSVTDVGAIVDPKLLKSPEGFRESPPKSLWMCPQEKFFLWFVNLLLLTDICIVYPVTE